LFALPLAAAYYIRELRISRSPLTPSPSITQTGRGAKRRRARTRSENRIGLRLRSLFLPFLLFLLIISAVIVPLILWQSYLTRAAMTPDEAGVFSLSIRMLIGLLTPVPLESVETQVYLGVTVVLLALIALAVQFRRHRFWIVVATIATLYALGSNGFLWSILVQIAPLLLWFRVPSRVWLVVTLVAALLAGFGLQALIDLNGEQRPKRPLRRVRLLTVAWIVLILGVGGVLAVGVSPHTGLFLAVVGTLIAGALLAALVLLMSARRIRSSVVASIALILVVADLALTGHGRLEWRGESDWLSPAQVALAERLIADGADRVYSPTYSLEQSTAEIYGLRLFGGVDPFQLRSRVEAIRRGGGIAFDGYSVVEPPLIGAVGDDLSQVNRDATIDTQTLADYGVSHVVAAYPIDHPRLNHLDTLDGVYVYENDDLAADDGSIDRLPDLDRIDNLTAVAALISGLSLFAGLVAVARAKT
jgi:hypothetical protein